jgi:hypothetical protein
MINCAYQATEGAVGGVLLQVGDESASCSSSSSSSGSSSSRGETQEEVGQRCVCQAMEGAV